MVHSCSSLPVIAIHPEGPPAASMAEATGRSGCSACLADAFGPKCRAPTSTAMAPAHLEGPPAELARLIGGLSKALGFAADRPEDGGVRSLRVVSGEVALTLAFLPGCGGGSELADQAFQALRAMLPDTDIYVLPAR